MKTYSKADAKQKMGEISEKLTTYDFNPNHVIEVWGIDGFRTVVPSAFALQYGDWLMVFAEHYVPTLHHMDEVEAVAFSNKEDTSWVPERADKFKPKKVPTKKKGVKVGK